MATYPTVGLRFSAAPSHQRRVDVSDAGGIHSVDLGETNAYVITIVHPWIDSSDRTTLLNFFDTNRTSTNSVTLGGTTYDFQFLEPYTEQSENAAYFTLTTRVAAVKQ